MAQLHACRLPSEILVLDLQTDLIDVGSRIVARLIPLSNGPRPLTRLEPIFEFDGLPHVLHLAEMAAVRSSAVSSAAVADLTNRDYEIRGALNMGCLGF
ncbi:ccdB protein [Roseovarius sp. A-2]|uniref:CcdB family protein n=1 Tax=Roseovarius sp. A-2 TaxID=1570360 RepID=UPI0009B53336|nr:CcdB family protein [Roseovarius sp. A-2]GAW36386.1 ccdB protein [Roseovarius sp. A-2]